MSKFEDQVFIWSVRIFSTDGKNLKKWKTRRKILNLLLL